MYNFLFGRLLKLFIFFEVKYFEFILPWKDFNYDDYFNFEKRYVSLVCKNRLTDDLEFLKLSFKIIENEIDK